MIPASVICSEPHYILISIDIIAELPLAAGPAGEASILIKACSSFFMVMASECLAGACALRATPGNIRDITFSFMA